MKRLCSLLLGLVLALTLCACQKAEPEPAAPGDPAAETPVTGADTPADAAPETPAADEYAWVTEKFGAVPDPARTAEMYEKLESGHVSVGVCAQDCSDSATLALAEGFMAYFEKLGAVNGGIFNALGDLSLQRQQIENCASYEMDMICVIAVDPSTLAAACETAMAAGTRVVLTNTAELETCGFSPSGIEQFPWEDCGRRLGDMLLSYFDVYFPRKKNIEIALGKRAEMTALFTGLEARLAEDERAAILYEQDGCLTLQDGSDVAEFALGLHEGTRVFVCADVAPAIGFNNYVMGHPELDPSEFIVLSAAGSEEAAALWALAEQDLAVYRGYCGLNRLDPAAGLNACAYASLLELTGTPCVYTTAPVCENTYGYTPPEE